jgi:hypothetical protein
VVNASLNWASIVGIVLAVCGGGLYFLRSFKPALARDYDVFFAAIGLLCGGILFFQGWRLDPILQFGQFLLAGTTVFFAYESVRLRGVATDQARRSSYFDDDPISDVPRNSRGRFNDDYDRFEESERPSRRFKPQEDEFEEDYNTEGRSRRRNVSRAIPSAAASRSRPSTREISQFENNEPIRRRRQTSEDRNSTGQHGEDRKRQYIITYLLADILCTTMKHRYLMIWLTYCISIASILALVNNTYFRVEHNRSRLSTIDCTNMCRLHSMCISIILTSDYLPVAPVIRD